MTNKELEEIEWQYKYGGLDIVDFLSIVPDSFIPNKDDLISEIKEKRMKKYDIGNNFSFHACDDDQALRCGNIRAKAKQLAYLIDDSCPDSRERSLAFTKLEEAVMWANAAIARNE